MPALQIDQHLLYLLAIIIINFVIYWIKIICYIYNMMIDSSFRRVDQIKELFDKLYDVHIIRTNVNNDPIKFLYQYKNPEDIEVSGFIASCLAYGRVEQFNPLIEKTLCAMGKSPYNFLLSFDTVKQGHLFSGIKHRFNKNKDIVCLLHILSIALNKYGSIEDVFKESYKKEDTDIGNGLAGFFDFMRNVDTSKVYGKNIHPRGLLHFFPSRSSALKRANLFLRWMVRDRDIDFGIWKGIPKNKLIIPLDTHIKTISKHFGFTTRASEDWKMAVEITGALKEFDKDDPLKYDFALCHLGISGKWKEVLINGAERDTH